MKLPTTTAFGLRATATVWWMTSSVNSQTVQLFPFTAMNTTLSDTCIYVLNDNVTCDVTLLSLEQQYGLPHGLPALLPASELTTLCTPACSFSLVGWVRRIQGACGGTQYWPNSNGDGGSFLPSSIAETFLEFYNSVCMTNSAGKICNTEIASVLKFDATSQNFTETPATSAICNTCVLSAIQTQLAMPLASKPDIASYFSSLTSSCGSTTGFKPSPTPTGTTFTIAATPAASPRCVGKTYTIGASDTCQKISASQGISTYDLIWNNNLTSACENFPKSGTLCIPLVASCETYTVLATDTCSSIQSKFSLLYSQLISWNPSLGVACQGLSATVGFAICVSTPGGSWINPNASDISTVAPPPTSLPAPTLLTGSMTAMTALPSATYVAYSSNMTTPYANSTRMDCISYITAPFLISITDNNDTVTSSSCSDAAAAYGVSLADFLLWNPDLSNNTSCVLADNVQYCAQITAVQAQDITDYCIEYQIPSSGHDCFSFAGQAGVDPSQFVLWNPSVGSDCSKFTPGLQYCVAVYHYQQPGIIPICNQFIVANETDWLDLPCQIIETKYGLSHARFVAWNPSVLNNCTEIYTGYDYCVSVPYYTPSYTSTTFIAASTAAAPTASITKTSTAKTTTTKQAAT
ncbi:hypothetical protein HD806DRAFT_475086 [Xylariaceae sp. AK1471]|nr:hypothetical protein HD806DRAFT_475086 [Xylariaceae sp. AK1471]